MNQVIERCLSDRCAEKHLLYLDAFLKDKDQSLFGKTIRTFGEKSKARVLKAKRDREPIRKFEANGITI